MNLKLGLTALSLALTLPAAALALPSDSSSWPKGHRFESYTVPAYSGPRHAPDFSGGGRKYRDFRSNIRDGFASNQLFSGHYVLIGAGCGTDCVSFVVGDVRTGRIYDFPLGGETNSDLELNSRSDSRLVRARWDTAEVNQHCVWTDLIWNGHTFTQLPVSTAPGACHWGS